MPTNVFTENKRARLQMQLQRDYELLVGEGRLPQDICNILLERVRYNLSVRESGLYDLSHEDQVKVYMLLNNLFQAFPRYPIGSCQVPQVSFVYTYIPMPQQQFESYQDCCYCPTQNALFTWLMLDTLWGHSRYHGGFGGSRYHVPSSGPGKKGDNALLVILIILAAMALAFAFVAMYYLFSQFLDDMERFWHNEGWMQAAISIIATAASGCAAALLTLIFLSTPLLSLAVGAGVSNPIGVVILSVICLSLVGAWLGGWIVNKIQEYEIKEANSEAIDIYDPHRYKLTESERINLISSGIDPEKVLTAMIAIRQVIGKEQLPSLLNRMFTREGGEKQALLNKIRQLRKGDIDRSGVMELNVPANEATHMPAYTLRFDLRASFQSANQYYYTQPPAYSSVLPQPQFEYPQGMEPSAPPYEYTS